MSLVTVGISGAVEVGGTLCVESVDDDGTVVDCLALILCCTWKIAWWIHSLYWSASDSISLSPTNVSS